MSDIRFRNTAHRDFFLENMMKCKVNDCYHPLSENPTLIFYGDVVFGGTVLNLL